MPTSTRAIADRVLTATNRNINKRRGNIDMSVSITPTTATISHAHHLNAIVEALTLEFVTHIAMRTANRHTDPNMKNIIINIHEHTLLRWRS